MLVLFCALCIGLIVGLLGSGPAILSLPVLLYMQGESFSSAILMSLIVGAIFSSFAGWGRITNVSVKSAMLFLPPAILGSFFGVNYSAEVSEFWRILLLSVVSFLAAGLIFYKLYKEKTGFSQKVNFDNPDINVLNILFFLFFSCVLGFLSALLGVSGGFLITPLFIGVFSLPLSVAVATSLFLSVLNSVLALFFYYQKNYFNSFLNLDWNFLSQFLAIGLAGVVLGVKFSKNIPQVILKKILGSFLFLLGLLNLYQAF